MCESDRFIYSIHFSINCGLLILMMQENKISSSLKKTAQQKKKRCRTNFGCVSSASQDEATEGSLKLRIFNNDVVFKTVNIHFLSHKKINRIPTGPKKL